MEEILIIHSHELNNHGELKPKQEYLARLKRALEMIPGKVSNILLTGGKATPGIDKRHCDAGKEFLIQNGISPNIILVESDPHGSLETVGEAIFAAKDHLGILASADRITLLSSDYHKKRILEINRFILGPNGEKLRFIGTNPEQHGNMKRTPEMEEKSLQAFYTTFAGVPAGNLDAILERLWREHHYYKHHPSNPYKDSDIQN